MYLAFDTETTGLSYKCNILTAHFKIFDKYFNNVDSLSLKIKHNVYTVYPKALEVNKIDLVEHNKSSDSVTVEEASKMLKEFLINNKTYKRYTPVGHNIQFDINMIKNNGLLDEQFYSKHISYNAIDTIALAEFLKVSGYLPDELSSSLVTLCKFLKVEDPEVIEKNSHNAAYDVELTIMLFKKFKELIRNHTSTNTSSSTSSSDTNFKKRKRNN